MKLKILGFLKLTKLFRQQTTGDKMAKEDVVAAAVAAVQAGEVQVLTDTLGSVYDQAVASVPPSGGGFTQSDIDAAVQAKVDADAIVLAQSQADDKKAFDDAKALNDAAMADLQGKLDALAAKEGQESGVIAGLQGSLQKLKDAEALLQSLFPAPVQPEPVSVDPAP